MDDKEIRADAKLKNLPPAGLEAMWLFRNPGEEGTKLTLEAIAVEVPLRFGFTVSVSTLSDFYAWLRVRKRLEARASLADQLKVELAKDPDISEEQITEAGQRLFLAEGILDKDAKVFAEMVKIGQNRTRLRQNDVKIGLQAKALDHDSRRLALLEAAAADAKAKLQAVMDGAKSTGGLTPETLRQIEEAAGLL